MISAWHPDSLGTAATTFVGQAVGRRLGVHHLRHSAASLMLAGGAPVKVVQQTLGHATASMTLDTYGHVIR